MCFDDTAIMMASNLWVTFGSGAATFSSNTPATFGFTTTYTQLFTSPIPDTYFAITNAVPSDNPAWHGGAPDHTPYDTNGYMFLANADPTPQEFFRSTVSYLCIGERYEFSAYLTNIVMPLGLAKPNVLFQIRLPAPDNSVIGQASSGDIPEYSVMTWTKYGISFVATNTSVVLIMISNTPRADGNDMAIDDISFRICSNTTFGVCVTG